jgi:dipeptidyl aminopeptidase/acylaminoacyl peptidase
MMYMLRLFIMLFMILGSAGAFAQVRVDSLFEDIRFEADGVAFFKSEKVDFLRIQSTVTEDVEFAAVIYKPAKPSPVLLLSHGWHQSVMPPAKDTPSPYPGFLAVQVDMRGREYSTGNPDCNGLELYDFYDTYLYLIEHYREYISDAGQVYYSGGSGGGGNGFAIIGKFPDLFCSAHISCGISDYAKWYENDATGEFRDEMIVWIGDTPGRNMEAYRSRSGITTVENVLTPAYIVHGETDVRVPVTHSREFVEAARKLKKQMEYLELENVGTRNHWGRITPEQEKQKEEFGKRALAPHPAPELPAKGKLIVAGYVVTKHFSVFMDSIDSVGKIKYNLKKRKASFVKGRGKIIWKPA